MENRITTMIIEPRLLVREALVSLMATHSYHVVGGVASTAVIDQSLLAVDAPKLVVLGELPPEDAASAAVSIRKLWPQTKIVLLFKQATLADFQKLLVSEIDGCIPLSAPAEMFIGALQQIIAADVRILVQGIATCSSMPSTTKWQVESDQLDLGTNSLAPNEKVGNGVS